MIYRAGEIIILGDNMRNNNDDFFNGVAEQIKKRENDEEEDFDRVWNEPWVERKVKNRGTGNTRNDR